MQNSFLRLLVLAGLWLLMSASAHAQTVGPYAHNNSVTPPNSGYINDLTLTGSAAATVTWPTGAAYVNINCATPPYWTSLQSGITVPSGNVTNGTGAALNAAQRQRSSGETAFYIISASSQECSFEFWSP